MRRSLVCFLCMVFCCGLLAARQKEGHCRVSQPVRWHDGHFQAHFIYTGVGESVFFIFPDGTTMLMDCGDQDAASRGEKAVPITPSTDKHAGEWVARYVRRVNPRGTDVDYMMLTHYHNDHAGCLTFGDGPLQVRDGRPYSVSGLGQVAEYLTFGKAFDRCYPDYDGPRAPQENPDESHPHMKYVYDYLVAHQGLAVEKFRVGETNQVAMLRRASRYPDFFVKNLCGNGRIAMPDGSVQDLYAARIASGEMTSVNENAMSLGMIIGYGPFRFFTAGDFEDRWRLEDGTMVRAEDFLATACSKVDVAKINHHGRNSMTRPLISALASRVWICCVWDQLHNTPSVMSRLSDRTLYEGDRTICTGVLTPECRKLNESKGTTSWLRDVPDACNTPCHIVLDVAPGGRTYSITLLDARDESLRVLDRLKFRTGR